MRPAGELNKECRPEALEETKALTEEGGGGPPNLFAKCSQLWLRPRPANGCTTAA